MAKQMKGGSFLARGAAKVGSKVSRWFVPAGKFFRPNSGDGIAAHGEPKSLEKQREAKDRRLG